MRVGVAGGSRCVLGIDLACRTWNDIGSALIRFDDRHFMETVPGAIGWPREDLTPAAVARTVDAFARRHDVMAVSMDGPQGWRDPAAPAHRPGVGRASEYATRTPGKTGPQGVAFPSTFLRWIRFSIDVFDALLRHSDVALVNHGPEDVHPRSAGYWLTECFPTSTWRTSGLDPLPGHRRAPPDVVERFARRLAGAFVLPASAVTRDHDDLQAVVAALPAVGLLGGPAKAYARGEPARSVGGVLVEGFIWDAAPASGTVAPITAPLAGSTVLIDERDTALESCVDRGVALFQDLVLRANEGEATGISYKGFVEHVHDVPFSELRGRGWSQADTGDVLRLADQITDAEGRQPIRRGDVVIEAGMDTFIWQKKPPHDRSPRAWNRGLPYSRAEWLAVFPDWGRRLIDGS